MHRTHLADEVGHVRWDEELIENAVATPPIPVLRKSKREITWLDAR